MIFSARYDVTEQLQDAMASQFFFAVLRPRLPVITVCFAVLAGLGALDLPYRGWIAGYLSAVALLIVVRWTQAFFAGRAQGRAGLKLMEHPRVELTLAWSKIERLMETKDFVVLMVGTPPLLSLPKAALPSLLRA